MMKNNRRLLFIFMFLTGCGVFAKNANQVYVQHILGQPQVVRLENQSQIQIKTQTVLSESIRVNTLENQLVEFQIREKFKLIVFPKSEVLIEGFDSEESTIFEVKKINIVSGQVYVQNFSKIPIVFSSMFFKWEHTDLQKYEEFFLDIDTIQAQLKVCAGETGLTVQLFDLEEVKKLDKTQGCQFQGVIEKGQIAFDYLLKGRKIPKGQWKENFTCDFKNILAQVNQIEKNIAKKNAEKNQKRKLLELQKKKDFEASLCHNPNGQLNECYWKYVGNECFRYRCNAQGQWAEKFLVSSQDRLAYCQKKMVVKKCNY